MLVRAKPLVCITWTFCLFKDSFSFGRWRSVGSVEWFACLPPGAGRAEHAARLRGDDVARTTAPRHHADNARGRHHHSKQVTTAEPLFLIVAKKLLRYLHQNSRR